MTPDIVLDTNVLLVSISPRSPYRWIFDAFIDEQFAICVTTEILFEYEEIITKHMGKKVAETVLQIIENAVNVNMITSYYKWNIINADPDDNKFTDCAISANAHFIVTEDKHFNIAKTIKFPKLNVIGIDEFHEVIIELNY
ncbi:MAG: putative toxin-antitoxin system toxin component, PIN family [Candidatus Cloacimonetes bacterium]|jgi:uncharacterized protein|nr:putative toxin-antitoxin system toxin component, PIN family [Candidatus Cloacimonadota bacterium]